MEGLTEGRIVHYIMPGSEEHRPAIVVKVWRLMDGTPPENGCSNLQVITDGPNDVPYMPEEKEGFQNFGLDKDAVRHGHFWATSILYSEKPEPGTWHWIEKA